MKKNPVIRWIAGAGLLLGGALVSLAATSEASVAGDPTATPAREETGTAVSRVRLRCDEPRIKTCHTECVRTCHQGPLFKDCSTRCDRDCRSRHCR
jgi:hypothetical protein